MVRAGGPTRRGGQGAPPGESDGARHGNSFGLAEALLGLLFGFILATLAVSLYAAIEGHHGHASQYGEDVVSLLALWTGLVGSAVIASRSRRPTAASSPQAARGPTGNLARDFGLRLEPWPDVVVGILAGVGSQYLLVPVVEAPLLPFVHNLYTRLGHPAQSLTGDAYGPGLVVLAVLVCVGSPVVEELFFRGLLLRALLGRTGGLGPRLGPTVSILVTALVFALAHFEALQFLGLFAFGIVLGVLAWRTGRLGPSIVAHMAFNTVTIIALVVAR